MSIDQDLIRKALITTIVSDVANNLIQGMKDELERLDKIVSKKAINSIEYFPNDKVVGSLLDYLYNIEFGRHAGSHVPIKPLHDWAVQKLNMSDDYAWAFAKDIEQRIFQEGIDMTRFTKLALQRMTNG